MRRQGLSCVVAASLGLAGCASEYMDRREGVSASAGEAIARNELVMAGDPWKRHSFNNDIATDGTRMARAQKRYRCGTSFVPDGGSQTNSTSTGSASRGNITINTQSTTTPTTQEVTNDC